MRKLQILGCCATVAVATVAAACSHHSLPGRVADPHADPGISKARAAQILNAVGAVSAQVSQAELAARGRALFFSSSFGRPGESCGTCHTGGGGVNPRIGTIVHPTKAGDFTGPRDPIQLWGVARTAPYTWTGNIPKLPPKGTVPRLPWTVPLALSLPFQSRIVLLCRPRARLGEAAVLARRDASRRPVAGREARKSPRRHTSHVSRVSARGGGAVGSFDAGG